MTRYLALIFAALAFPALADEAIYRCPGDVYQNAPCSGGRALNIDTQANTWHAPAPSAYVPRYSPPPANGPYVAGIPNGRETAFTRPAPAYRAYYPRERFYLPVVPVYRPPTVSHYTPASSGGGGRNFMLAPRR